MLYNGELYIDIKVIITSCIVHDTLKSITVKWVVSRGPSYCPPSDEKCGISRSVPIIEC